MIASLAALWWLAAMAVFLLSVFGTLLQPRIQRRRASSDATPPISLILPVKLVNPGFERAQASVFDQDYPDYEILVGALESRSSALVAMRTLGARARPQARFITSVPHGATSPKLDTMATPIAQATHDVVVTKDSNVSFAPDMLRAMMRSLTPDVGLVCAVPVAVRPDRLAGRIEAVLINRDARLLFASSMLGKGYGVGKTTAFRRSDLARIGGIETIGYTIAEDTALSRELAKIGLKTVFADAPVAQEIGTRAFADVFGRQIRWAVIRRAEEPFTFAFEPIASPLLAALAAALAFPALGFGAVASFAVMLIGWYLVEVLVAALAGWELRPWTPLAVLGRELVLLGAWARAWTTREVVWAGRKQDVRNVLRQPQRT